MRLAGLALLLSLSCGLPTPEAPALVRGATVLLTELCAKHPDDGMLDLALGFLESGDVPGCIAALKADVIERAHDNDIDPLIPAVLNLLEQGTR